MELLYGLTLFWHPVFFFHLGLGIELIGNSVSLQYQNQTPEESPAATLDLLLIFVLALIHSSMCY